MNKHLIRLDQIQRLKNSARPPVKTPGVSTVMPAPRPVTTAKGFKVRSLKLLRAAAARRQPGYLDACLKLGELDATGQYVTFSRAAFAEIRQKFSLKAPPIKIIKPCC